MNTPANTHSTPIWPLILGAVFTGLTLIFLMGLILLGVAGHAVPCSQRFLVAAMLALSVALGSSFLGGSAAARGQLPWKGATSHPISFAVTGGVAVFVITLVLGAQLYDGGPDCVDAPTSSTKTFVRGRVLGDAGAPVGGAKISVTGVGSRVTDQDGVFELPINGRSGDGQFSLNVYAIGYAVFTRNFDLDGGDEQLGDLRLARAQ